MADLTVIVPSRGRPEAARSLAQTFASTCTADTRLVFAVDEDDPTLPEYSDVPRSWADRSRPTVNLGIADAPSNMVKTLNAAAAMELTLDQPPFAIGFMGDDHCPRTHGWDSLYLDALRELGTGIVYGNDLFQGELIPTQVAMTSDIIRTLGCMAPPTLTHLYVDNFWKDLGVAAGCLRYLPDVIVEHRHPLAGKAGWDAGYARVNSSSMYERDRLAYEEYLRTRQATDVDKVVALRSAHV